MNLNVSSFHWESWENFRWVFISSTQSICTIWIWQRVRGEKSWRWCWLFMWANHSRGRTRKRIEWISILKVLTIKITDKKYRKSNKIVEVLFCILLSQCWFYIATNTWTFLPCSGTSHHENPNIPTSLKLNIKCSHSKFIPTSLQSTIN